MRRLHRAIGIVMLLPFIGWALTGFVFFVKPGYGGAYEALALKTYPLEGTIALTPDPAWREFRYLKTILGVHLLARTDKGWVHLDANTLQPAAAPGEEQIRQLLTDAFAANAVRYGRISDLDGATATTDTGARVTLDWNRLSLQQRGTDTDRIDLLYRIHYLQWTGSPRVDRVVGFTGLVLVIGLTALGARLAFKRR